MGLAGKLSVLGRATSLADYVLVGQEEVGTIRVFSPDQNHKTLNISPSRCFPFVPPFPVGNGRRGKKMKMKS